MTTNDDDTLLIEDPENGKRPSKEPWQTDLDARKDLIDVDMTFRRIIGRDYKKAYFNEKEIEFIGEMVPAAIEAEQLCPNKEIGKQIMEMDFALLHTLAILRFNRADNPVLSKYTVPTEPEKLEEQQDEGEGFFKRLIKNMKKTARKTDASDE